MNEDGLVFCPQPLREARDLYGRVQRRLLECAIEIGDKLIAAKASVPHGEWEAVVEDHWPWGSRHARRFIAIAQSEALRELASNRTHESVSAPANRTHESVLPSDIAALAVLSKVPKPILVREIERGRVHSEMSRDEAQKLDRRLKIEAKRGKDWKPKPPPTDEEKAEKQRKRDERERLLRSVTDEQLERLGPIAEWENDIVQFARFLPDYKESILIHSETGMYNRLAAVIMAVDAEKAGDQGVQIRGSDGGLRGMNPRVMPIMLKLGDALQPLTSAVNKAATAIKRARTEIEAMRAAAKWLEPTTLGKVPEILTQEREEGLRKLARELAQHIPFAQCDGCDGYGAVDGREGPCPECLGRGWLASGATRKRRADRAAVDRLRGREDGAG